MLTFTPQDPVYEQRIRESFSRQGLLQTFGAEFVRIAPGEVELKMPFDPRFTQQDGFLHAGTITALVDSACGYAAYSLMPADSRVLSVEFKINLLLPASGDQFMARGTVIRTGKTITVCEGKFFSYPNGDEKLNALMQATMICV